MKTKNKLRISLTIIILMPVLVLWIVAIASNTEGLQSVRAVNTTPFYGAPAHRFAIH